MFMEYGFRKNNNLHFLSDWVANSGTIANDAVYQPPQDLSYDSPRRLEVVLWMACVNVDKG